MRTVLAEEVQHLSITLPGGMPGFPIITGIEALTNGLRVTWDGPAGYYQLYQKLTMDSPSWQLVGPERNLSRNAMIITDHTNAFFQIKGPPPEFAGSQACLECHANLHGSVMETRHSQAFETLKKKGQDKNPSCLPCHTVGFGLPTGFSSEISTPHLTGVQCESCHGPAGNHATRENDPLVRPRVELASQVCGGCHTGSEQPQFEQWHSSAHAVVVEDMNPSSRILSCGRCHSGSARLSLLKSEPPPTGDANVPIVCSTCHDPHQNTGHPAQLRNPVVSTKDYSLSTSSDFSTTYDPSINICAQCHNHRGASWTSSGRPPHHSPQYNLLLGTVGELPEGVPAHRARHATLDKQCISCHMASEATSEEAPSPSHSHSFKVERFDSCRSCHPLPELLVDFSASAISFRVQEVNRALNLWATNKAPAALQERYSTRAWEYSNPGQLSSPGPGPNSSEQALIPNNIKKARFNLYLVLNDGSQGVHNGPHSIKLLEAARDWVTEELNK